MAGMDHGDMTGMTQDSMQGMESMDHSQMAAGEDNGMQGMTGMDGGSMQSMDHSQTPGSADTSGRLDAGHEQHGLDGAPPGLGSE